MTLTDRYDSFDENAGRQKLLILFKNLVNYMYSKDLGKKIRSSFATKQQKGELLGSKPPYGYVFAANGKKKYLEIELEAAKTVKLIFDLRLQGLSTVKIAEYLNANNIPTPGLHYYQIGVLTNEKYTANTVWQNNFICRLLVNEVYTGSQVQGKYDRNGKKYVMKPKSEWIIHKNTHTAIVEEAQFEAVQRLMAEASGKYKKHGNKLDDNIFAGKIFCLKCSKAAKREYYRGKNGVKYSYHCRYCDAELRRVAGLDTIRPVPMEQLETAVTEIIRAQINVCLEIDGLLDKVSHSAAITSKRYNLIQERDKFIKAGKRAGEFLSASYTHHLNGLLSGSEFELARAKFENDKQAAAVSLAHAEQELSEYELDEVRKNDCLANFRVFNGFDRLDKSIIAALINRIEITPLTNDIVITLNFKDSFEKLGKLVTESEVMTNVC